MSNPKKRKHRGVNQTGRSKGNEPFVMLRKYLLQSVAYRSLGALERAVYTELRRRFNGTNNGSISCSCRELSAELHCGKDTARSALRALEQKGFIKCAQKGSFDYKVRHAPLWVLTEESWGDSLPTKDFMRWRPEEKAGPCLRTGGPQRGTVDQIIVAEEPQSVLGEGPTHDFE